MMVTSVEIREWGVYPACQECRRSQCVFEDSRPELLNVSRANDRIAMSKTALNKHQVDRDVNKTNNEIKNVKEVKKVAAWWPTWSWHGEAD